MPRRPSTHVDDPRRVGERLREARTRAGVSQRQLAFDGCTAAYISRIEAGERTPSLQLIHEFGRRLDVDPQFLATGVAAATAAEPDIVEAEVALRLGDLDEAERLFREHLDGSDSRRAAAIAGLGQIAFRCGREQEAIARLEEALALRRRLLDDPAGVETLARAYATVGALESAAALLDRAFAEAQEAEAPVEALRFAVLLANALTDSALYARAEEVLATAIRLAADLHDPLGEARVYWTQSRLHALRDDAALAARYARKALEILERTENDGYVAMAYHLLAYAEVASGRPEEALDLLGRGRELFGTRFGRRDEAKFSLEEARALLSLGRTKPAARAAARTLEVSDELDPQDRGRAFLLLGDVFAAAGDRDRARELYESAVDLLEEHGRPFVIDAAARLSDFLEEEGETEEALRVLRRAMRSSRAERVPADRAGA